MKSPLMPKASLWLLVSALSFPALAHAQEDGTPPRELEVTAEPGFEADQAEPGFEEAAAAPSTTLIKGEAGFDAIAIPGAKDVSKESSSLKRDHDLTIKTPGRSAAAAGQFTRRKRGESVELLAVTPERGLELYRNTSSLIRDKDVVPLTAEEREALGVDVVARPVQLVRDGTSQLMVWRKAKDRRGDVVYKVTIYKVIGDYLGEVLDREIGRIDRDTKKPVRTARVEVLASGGRVKLKLIPVRRGADRPSAASVLEWDAWEGVFVEPRLAPTSPIRGRNLNF
jgi:hypothetical protein